MSELQALRLGGFWAAVNCLRHERRLWVEYEGKVLSLPLAREEVNADPSGSVTSGEVNVGL
jgi:hypothetical protein